MSAVALQFLGGILANAPAFAALTNPTVNSYKRLNASTTASDAATRPQPHDRYHLAFFILYLQGVGCLFPWNAFITKTDYYNLAFRGSEYESSFESIVATHADTYGLPPCWHRLG